ncbi:serine palmitoyltransferase small subunit B [Scaptodrosophila lebanonensis]|uniref:Serine palmitoyltransferase small subunit B n=1 Tax=Drosophila lebanonensis TaxID=7225 RepID=A0A6J2UJE9_DROLE|nr:serine palmitoyltransferase small subunit B [Scaptodrosophila lebanonensis]
MDDNKRKPTAYEKFIRSLQRLYFVYELNTQISICEPWEKVFCNLLLCSCLCLILYASFAYVPSYCLLLFQFLVPGTASNTSSYTSADKFFSAESFYK